MVLGKILGEIHMRTLAIIVLYNPSLDELMITIKDLTAFNINICLVDNSEIFNDFSDYAIFDNLSVIRNSSNLGIAQAQNIGVMHGISIYDSFLFLDQDSSLSSNFVIDSLDFLNNPDMLVQVPIVKNKFTNTIYPASVINEYGLPHKVLVDSCQKYQKIDIGISSGTIVKSEVFKLNILFKEFLFIDFVDIEWFLNCRKNSIDVYQNNKIYLLHLIGGESVKILNRHILVHNEIGRAHV